MKMDSLIDSGIGHLFFGICTGQHIRLCGIHQAGGAPGHCRMTFDAGGSDCGFTSYEKRLATASGIDAECHGKTTRDDSDDRNQ